MDKSNSSQLPKSKCYVIAAISFITFSLMISTSLFYIRKYPFGNTVFFNYPQGNLLSISTISTESTSSIVSNLTATIKLITVPTTTDFNEVLCNNLTDSGHPLNNPNNPCERIRCAVITHRNGGRLGNRMFLFASAYGLARTHGCRLFVANDVTNELRHIFKMSMKENLWLPENQAYGLHDVVRKETVCTFLPEMLRPNAFKNIELRGYWQSYLYFDGYREEIRDIFTGKPEVLARLAGYFDNQMKIDCPTCSISSSVSHSELRRIIRTNYNITWIGIHIRRKDFTGLGYASNDQYIRRAIAYYKRRFYKQKLRFLVASDDKPYCAKLFANEINSRQVIILPIGFPRGDDLIALSFCHHSIVTGGTYGFWAAYLSGGEVVHDIAYPAGCARSDYYPPWFKLVGVPRQKIG